MTAPSIAVIIPVMDRAPELRASLPTILAQTYPSFTTFLVDCGSNDDIGDVFEEFKDPRLKLLRIPRPKYFSFSISRNIGVRYSKSELLLFLNGDDLLSRSTCLTEMMDLFLHGSHPDRNWFSSWRSSCNYMPVDCPRARLGHHYRMVFCHTQGSVLLVERRPFQELGGFNEMLEDWGYEDTDLIARLQLAGFGRLEAGGIDHLRQSGETALRTRNFRQGDTEKTWTRNRLISDRLIRRYGAVFAPRARPGYCERTELLTDTTECQAEAQDWEVSTTIPADEVDFIERLRDFSFQGEGETAIPMVSVIVPCKDRAAFLRPTIDSILNQNYPNIECLVIDGASTDETLEILAEYGSRIRWTSRPDRGAFDAINEGWQMSRGDILTWLNADDVWAPGAVVRVVAHFLEHPEADVAYGHCAAIDENGEVINLFPAREWSLTEALINCDHIIHQSAAFMRRGILERVGWLYPAWCHDHDLWLRIASAGGQFQIVDSQLASARIWRENLGNFPGIVVPAKIGLTERFFAQPGLPTEIRRLKRRSMSNAYLKALSYIAVGGSLSKALAAKLVLKAILWDYKNIPSIAAQVTRGLVRKCATPVLLVVGRVHGSVRHGRLGWPVRKLVGSVRQGGFGWPVRKLVGSVRHGRLGWPVRKLVGSVRHGRLGWPVRKLVGSVRHGRLGWPVRKLVASARSGRLAKARGGLYASVGRSRAQR